MTVEQGYPGGPRPEGAHRAVDCSQCGRPEARRTLISRVNAQLTEIFSTREGHAAFQQALRENPDDAERLRKALNL